MNSAKYWEQRRKKLEEQLEKDEKRLMQSLAKDYAQSMKELEKDIAYYYSEYGKDNIIEYRNLLQSLSQEDRQMLYQQMDMFSLKYPEYAHLMPVRASIYKLNRLEGLKQDIYIRQCELGIITEKKLSDHLKGLAKKSYKIAGGRNIYNHDALEKLVGKKWVGDDTFSERVWKNTKKLTNTITNEFQNAVIRGDNYEKCTSLMRKRFDVSRSEAHRLVYTEGTFIMNEASMTAFEENYEYYEYCAVMDSSTSEICQNLDGKKFKISERQAGVNFPPMHPLCRSSYLIDIDDEDELQSNIENDKIETNYKVVDDDLEHKMQKESDITYMKCTKEERYALREYTQGGYLDINLDLAELRENYHVRHLSSAIGRYSLEEDIIVYRGTKLKYYDDFVEGDIFDGNVFYSTSINREQAVCFADDIDMYDDEGCKGIVLEIRVPRKSKCLYIGNNTDYMDGDIKVNEKELLIHNETRYKMIERNSDGIVLEVVNE